MQSSLPTVEELMNGSWSLLEPFYRELESIALSTENVAEWLSGWSRVSRLVSEVYSRL